MIKLFPDQEAIQILYADLKQATDSNQDLIFEIYKDTVSHGTDFDRSDTKLYHAERKEFIERLGHAFDERYFFWFEDVDLCREAKRLGWRVVYTPIISCVDFVGQSVKKKKFWWKQWQFTKSACQYFWKLRK